jgi:hypothetical protein
MSQENKIFQYLNIMNECSASAVLSNEIIFWEGFELIYPMGMKICCNKFINQFSRVNIILHNDHL